MKWCPHCKKYVATSMDKTKLRAIKYLRFTYHCSECNGFIESADQEGEKTMRKLKLYLDTSVWNFYFADDAPEKRDVTKDFIDLVRQEQYEVFISAVVVKEINDAPEPKRAQLVGLIKSCPVVELEITEAVDELAKSYIARGILSEKKEDDALHVAIATATEMDALVTWNFQHLANLRKSELFNGVNLEKGYTKRLEIVTPMEVSKYES